MEDAAVCEIDLASRIRAARKSAGVSVTYVAKLLGITRPVVYAIEAGTRRLYVEELLTLARAFGVDPCRFLQAEEPDTLDDCETARSTVPFSCPSVPAGIDKSAVEANIAAALISLYPGPYDRILRLVTKARAEKYESSPRPKRVSTVSVRDNVLELTAILPQSAPKI